MTKKISILASVFCLMFLISFAGCKCSDNTSQIEPKQKEQSPEIAENTNELANKDVLKEETEKEPDFVSKFAKDRKAPPKHLQVTGDNILGFKACTSKDDIKNYPDIRICEGTFVGDHHMCFCPFPSVKKDESPLELWVIDGKLSHANINTKEIKTPQNIGVGDVLADILSVYKTPNWLRGDDKEWIVAIPELKLHFYLDDNKSENENKIDRFARITKMVVNFDCFSK